MKVTMRRGIESAAILAMAVLLGVAIQNHVYAQRQRMSPEDRTKQLKEQLNLTDTQADSVLAIVKAAQDDMRAAFQSSNGGDRSAMRESMQQRRQKADDAISKLLTGDQRKKFEELRKQVPPKGRRGGNN